VAAGVYDLAIEQGATFRRLLRLKDSAGAVIVLTGYTVRAQIRAKVTSPDVLWSITATVSNAAAGEVTLYISDEDTATFDWKSGVWDLELEQPDGDVIRLLKGKVTNDFEVTR
jgi:hypothetical protein